MSNSFEEVVEQLLEDFDFDQDYETCARHAAWWPCHIKKDWESECVHSDDIGTATVVRAYHSGYLSKQQVSEVMREKKGVDVIWHNGLT